MLVEGVCLLAVLIVFFIIDEMFRKRRLPPGPMPLPIIGNLHLLSDKPHLDFYQLALRYGPVYRLQMGSNLAIVINQYSLAREALVRNGSVFSGRPSIFAGKMFSRDGKGVAFQGNTKQMKQQRKAIIQTMRAFEKDGSMEELVNRGIQELIENIERHFYDKNNATLPPEVLRKDVAIAKNHVISAMALRYNNTENWDYDRHASSQITDAVAVFAKTLAATNIIDAFPFMEYIPFDMVKKLKTAVQIRDKIFEQRYHNHKKVFDPSFHNEKHLADVLIQMLEESRGNPANEPADVLTDDHVMMTINDAIVAASESPATTLITIIYFLVKFPDMQARIHREIDDVIGRDKSLQFSDRNRLPYLNAFIHECLRYAPVMPLAVPHQTTADTSIGPYNVPRKTMIFVNVYAIHRDPEMWQNPLEFKPERFLDKEGTLNTAMTSNLIVFGVGNRNCPGEILSRMEMFLFTAQLLHKYTFSYKGQQLPPEEEGDVGLVLHSPDIEVAICKRQ